ncbi:Glyoxylase, beta-lactamase superfamily II [Desulfonispora thiosulfatigenes DSM 11270]|uniref:Glyoxylase, beta-lactamase superfamily II n=1 Tax=Desulfonispora thiosulfatigenes DSM 11270 TaxID=656914 RepID=A0A1W1UIR0_DESTI|nr:MBL fold metallo-hydrolase [Desulfonispora thiosulfatigenes]SMB80919.1 Glyoxylase, beta-lactamase superfamily II [Desulfonispora thiosulfatigenes DSM 11270]
MIIKKMTVGIHEANAYIIHEEGINEALIIDPGDGKKTIVKYLDKNKLQLKGIVLTHYHYDHTSVANGLKKKYNCPIYAHKKELEGLGDPEINQSTTMHSNLISITPDIVLSDGDIINLGNLKLSVIHTPGHTPGGICLKVNDTNVIFTGDTIFSDDLGRTDLAGGSEILLKKTISNKVSQWTDETIIYPGHGETATMQEVRKKDVPFLNKKK